MAGQTAETGGSPAPGGPLTTGEKTAVLDHRLGRSLEEFDGLLLSEQEELAEVATAGGGGGGAGGSTGGHPGGQAGGQPGGSGASTGEKGDEATSGGSPDAPAGGSETGAPMEAGAAGEGNSERVPADVGNGNDDDIIARQLREAAMAEDDPELRDKLWQEYRDYKASVSERGDE